MGVKYRCRVVMIDVVCHSNRQLWVDCAIGLLENWLTSGDTGDGMMG